LKFEMSREPGKYFLAWTTTPCTLPGNLALAIDPGSSYVKVEQNGEKLILAKSRTEALVGGYKVIEEFSGEKLLGESYKPLFDFAKYEEKAYYLIDGSDFVSTDEGTGIVHTAVMYGAEDFLVGKKTGLPEKHTVDLNGKFSPEVKPWAGTDIFEANPLIIKDLKDRGFLYKEQPVTHSYPFCWRCHRPLIYYALESWFIKTTAEKDKIITENKKINWVPSSIKTGRMGNWLETMLDWALSRSRYWGTPLPIWICDKCGDVQIVDSIETLKKKALNPERLKGELDLHRPYIDGIKLKCDKCGGIASRVEYVLDCWFDSGSMPYGQWHYPFENKEEFEEQFPANFISEAQDQTRGWFYTLLVISSLVTGKASYKNVVCPNLVLDEKGQKMSKSLGNAVDPWEVMDKFGADATRWYFYSSVSLGNEYRFGFKSVEEVVRRFLLTLWNTYNFFVTYANIDGWEPGNDLHPNKNVLDQWMTSKLNRLIAELTKSLDGYNAFEASSLIENFVSDFSTWYIRRSRDRIGPTTVNSDDKNDCFSTLHHTLVILSQLLAPFTPFIAEEIYKNLTGEKSVHLSIWPVSDNELIDDGLEEQMELVRRINEIGHSIRKENLIKVRQPLQSIKVSFSRKLTDERLIQLIKEELNVKSVVFSEEKVSELSVELDTVITPELEREGEAREQVREIQIARKEKGYELNEKINITLPSWPEEFEEYIKRETLAINLKKGHFGIEKP
ncbi:MAG: isoleucine--tRNA ligase, partial [bacterium]|nr:isoleucine--tRNA ligase [bacterium]